MFTSDTSEVQYNNIFVQAIDGFYDQRVQIKDNIPTTKQQPWKAFSKKYNKDLQTNCSGDKSLLANANLSSQKKETEQMNFEIDGEFLKKLDFDFDNEQEETNFETSSRLSSNSISNANSNADLETLLEAETEFGRTTFGSSKSFEEEAAKILETNFSSIDTNISTKKPKFSALLTGNWNETAKTFKNSATSAYCLNMKRATAMKLMAQVQIAKKMAEVVNNIKTSN